MKPEGFSVMFLWFVLALKIIFMKPCFFDVRKNISSFLCLLKKQSVNTGIKQLWADAEFCNK